MQEQAVSVLDQRSDRCRSRDEFIEQLRKDRAWFKKRRAQLQYMWIVLTAISLLLGFLTSIFIAIGWPSVTEYPGKAILVALPSIGSFCGTILIHFRLRENWELRELGRIDVEEAIVRASFLPLDDPVAFAKGLFDLEIAHVQLKRLQTAKFFATVAERPNDTNAGGPKP